MSRKSRKYCQLWLYHIIFRGIGRQNIFEENADYEKLKEIILKVKQEMKFELYAYCFMSNHVHIFVKENKLGELPKIMSKILSHYATWFNVKYLRSGALFGNRYKSEPVEDERYFLGLTRYIHQNPLKAKMISNINNYPYSSYHDYTKADNSFTDIDFLLKMLNSDKNIAIRQFVGFHEAEEDENYEITESQKNRSEHIRRIIISETDGKEPYTIKHMDKEERNRLIKRLVFDKGISKSALERATGISRGTIIRICNKM